MSVLPSTDSCRPLPVQSLYIITYRPDTPLYEGGAALSQENDENELKQTNYWHTMMEVSQGCAITFLVLQGIVSILGHQTLTALFLSMAVAAGLINRIAARRFLVHWNLCFNSKEENNNK
jgi:hypothetical protein